MFVSASPSACDTSSQKRKLAAVASQKQDVFWDLAPQTLTDTMLAIPATGPFPKSLYTVAAVTQLLP